MRRLAVLGVVLAGCGRIGFDTVGSTSDGPADARSCDPVTRLDRANWVMPNDPGSGLPNVAAYTTSPDRMTITDEITGLVWQRTSEPVMHTWSSANTYCDDLELGGACDWRLPQRIELVSIVDYSSNDPAIDAAFVATSELYWSATQLFGTPSMRWTVNFATGHTNQAADTSMLRVRCVRAGADEPGSRFQSTVDTVFDTQTLLTWERVVDPGSYTWLTSQTYCGTLATAGGGWRVPSIRELESIVETSVVNPAIPQIAFPNTPTTNFWTGNQMVADASMGWSVSFATGIAFRALGSSLRVRCVR